MMRSLVGLALALLLQSATAVAADGAASIVNRAGEQRMLSQRIVKAYTQVGLNVMPAVAMMQIGDATTRFEANLEALRTAAEASPAATRAWEQLAGEWRTMRQAAGRPVSRDTALALSRQADVVLAAAERLVGQLEGPAAAVDRLVNLAGRQRMLSQRVAKAYLLKSWNVDAPGLARELDEAVKAFSEGLKRLQARPDNTEEVRAELEGVAQQWEWLLAALAAEGASSYRLIVAEAADAILDATDRVTELYDRPAPR